MMRRLVVVCVFLIACSSPMFAWGEKGHAIVNEAATYGTPAAMPAFFHRAYPRLVYLSYEPDRFRAAGPSLEAVNPPDHFLNAEYINGIPLSPDRYQFLHELEVHGVFTRNFITGVGFLPWRIAEMCDELTVEWRLWLTASDARTRLEIERNIITIAGVLGHFVGDAANPQHTTINYNGWVQENPDRFRYDCDTHWRFETSYVSRVMSSPPVYSALRPLKVRDRDYFGTAIAFVRESNGLVETLYRIDRDRGFDTDTDEAREFTVERLAAGASLLRDLWYSCYVNAAEPREKSKR